MRAANVKDGRLALSDVLRMNFDRAEQATFGLRFGDVLVTEGCGSIGELGASARWSNELHSAICFQNTLLRLRARPGVALPGFVEQWSRWAHKSGIWAGVASGTNIFHIGLTRAKKVPILLPPLAEQRRIVDLIAAVDAAIEAAEREREGLETGIKAASREMIDAVDAVLELGDVAAIVSNLVDPRTPTLKHLPHVGIEQIEKFKGTLGPLHSAAADAVTSGKFLFQPGEVVYSKIRPELRKAFLSDFTGLCSADAYPLRCTDRVTPEYLFEVLLSDSFTAKAVGKSGRTKMPKINRNELFSIAVPVPTFDEQARVAGLIGSLRLVAARSSELVEALTSLRSALLADLLSSDHEIPASYDELLSA
jgi:hypothetical protein